jgi:hypothetical protein
MQDLSIRYNLWRLNLKWTKLKKLVMEKTAPEVLKRIDFQIARYRTNKKEEGRCFILLDKQEVFSACTFTKRREKAKLLSSYSEEEADKILKERKIISQYEFYDAFKEYISLSIDDAVNSDNFIIRALSLIDKRFGKRRLLKIKPPADKNDPEYIFLKLRCESLGLYHESLKNPSP